MCCQPVFNIPTLKLEMSEAAEDDLAAAVQKKNVPTSAAVAARDALTEHSSVIKNIFSAKILKIIFQHAAKSLPEK